MTGKITLNNEDRAAWLDNEEGLQQWWKQSKLSKKAFIQQYKADLDALIMSQLTRKPQR